MERILNPNRMWLVIPNKHGSLSHPIPATPQQPNRVPYSPMKVSQQGRSFWSVLTWFLPVETKVCAQFSSDVSFSSSGGWSRTVVIACVWRFGGILLTNSNSKGGIFASTTGFREEHCPLFRVTAVELLYESVYLYIYLCIYHQVFPA